MSIQIKYLSEDNIPFIITNSMNSIIRPECKEEYEDIYHLIQTAFSTAEVKDGTEQDYANKLRAGNWYIPELALVAEKDGKIIGHIMLTKTYIQQNNGEKMATLLVAPLSVLLEYRNQGVGSQLMKEGLARARSLGYTSAFLLGDPKYYQRFWFKASTAYNVYPPAFISKDHWENTMAIELQENALATIEGEIIFDS